MRGAPRERQVQTPGVRAAGALTRHAGIYALGSIIGLVLSFGNAIFVTQYLGPSDFGQLGLALVTASLVTIGLSAPIGQGALIRTFGATADEAEGEADVQGTTASRSAARRSFGSALVATTLAGGLLSLVGTLIALLLLEPFDAAVMAGSIVSGTLGALWRYVSTVPRLQRRPVVYVALTSLRPIAVVGLTVPLVTNGGGVIGALAGVALGTALAVGVGASVVRSTFCLALDRDELRMMLGMSRRFLPLIAGGWVITNADLYIIASFASAAQVGEYRLASRLGALGSYGTSAFLSAWSPLERSEVFRASDEVHGRRALRGALLFHFLLICLLLVLTLGVMADELVQVAPPAYARAAKLLPALALAFVTQGIVVGLYRAGSFTRKAPVFRNGTGYAGLAYVPLAIGLVALVGAPGAAYAAAVVFAVLALALARGTLASGERFGVPAARLGAATVLAAVFYVGTSIVDAHSARAEFFINVAAPVLFVLSWPLLWPPEHRRRFWAVLREMFSWNAGGVRD